MSNNSKKYLNNGDFAGINKVAVYGSLRKGLSNHSVIEKSRLLGFDFVEGFSMYPINKSNGFPFALQDNSENSIKVEVYEINNESTKMRLDSLEGYPSFYDRVIIDTEFGKCWIYVLNMEKDTSSMVSISDWKKYLEEDKTKYNYAD